MTNGINVGTVLPWCYNETNTVGQTRVSIDTHSTSRLRQRRQIRCSPGLRTLALSRGQLFVDQQCTWLLLAALLPSLV